MLEYRWLQHQWVDTNGRSINGLDCLSTAGPSINGLTPMAQQQWVDTVGRSINGYSVVAASSAARTRDCRRGNGPDIVAVNNNGCLDTHGLSIDESGTVAMNTGCLRSDGHSSDGFGIDDANAGCLTTCPPPLCQVFLAHMLSKALKFRCRLGSLLKLGIVWLSSPATSSRTTGVRGAALIFGRR